MRAPKYPIDIDDTVIVHGRMVQIMTAEWHTGYSQWHFNKDKDEFFERQIEYWFDVKKNKWKEYK